MANIGGLRYPLISDDPNIATDIRNLANDVNDRQTKSVSDMGALDSISDMRVGDQVFVVAEGQTATYDGTTWSVRNTQWVFPTPLNGWSATTPSGVIGFNSTPAYIRRNDTVWIRGIVGNGSAGLPVFTLPSGFRPTSVKSFANHIFGSSSELQVRPNGDVLINQAPSAGNLSIATLDCSFLLF